MKIDGFQTNSALSFKAIHPTKFYVRCEDGKFHKVVDEDVIKLLRRKIVTQLNKDYYDKIRLTEGKPVKKEAESEKSMRERLVRFFVNRDADYRENNIVRSFSTTDIYDEPEVFILTGKSTEIVNNEAKHFEDFHSDLRERAALLSDSYGIEVEKVKKYISDRSSYEKNAIARQYYDVLSSKIKKILKRFDPNNSLFEAFFVAKVKGKNVKYELVDAKFNHK